MSPTPIQAELPDAHDRDRAVATFDQSVIVTAGAGTGKTTLLVDRLVHLLLRNPEPLKITEIVALTFTNKAADEMKLRLRERLQNFLVVELHRKALNPVEEKNYQAVQQMIDRYQLSKAAMDERIHEALRHMERSDIGTIHSFAANLLRLYPLEAGIDPQFHEDDGHTFDRLFDEHWEIWLDQELELESANAAAWRKIFGGCQLDQVKALAKSISAETVDLERKRDDPSILPSAVKSWLSSLAAAARALTGRHSENRLNERLVRAAEQVLGEFLQSGTVSEKSHDAHDLLAQRSINRGVQGWDEADIASAQGLVRSAKGLLGVDNEVTQELWRLLSMFARGFRERFIRDGQISFDGLLVRARDLVRDQRRVRAELKRRYKSILIDEFQDTDPIQYEILLYLAEQSNQNAAEWRHLKIAPGKIFVVGDPKQSIYAFRRADIEAYLEVVEKIIKAQDGIECRLTTNFRSDAAIIDAVNGVFDHLMRAQPGLQPPYIAIEPAPGRAKTPQGKLAKVTVRKIVTDQDTNAETARRLEGESLARWLTDAILGKLMIMNARGDSEPAQPKDIAVLFRKLTDIHDYLEPFRRYGIRYVVEGERHFYAAKEIIDAVNLLRAVENPFDRLALVGVLRSPLGGFTDREIYDLHRLNLLDYRARAKLDKPNIPTTVARLYETLARLNVQTRTLPIGAAIAHVFEALPVESLAACHFHGEQAVANLAKLKQMAEDLGREGLITLKEAIRQLEKRVLDVKEEGESVLAEENVDAVRVMSIHKAKGLEFPVVILAGCHTGAEGRRAGEAISLYDWSTDLAGLRVGQINDLAGLYIGEKIRQRNVEEQKRLLYVAMTRAREHLILSCAPSNRRSRGSFLSLLDEALNDSLSEADSSTVIAAGEGKLAIEVVSETLKAPFHSPAKPKRGKKPDWKPYVNNWARRATAYEKARQTATFLTPTSLKPEEEALSETGEQLYPPRPQQTPALVVGDLAHRFLQDWTFRDAANNFKPVLRRIIDVALAPTFVPIRDEIEAELDDILGNFLNSQASRELAQSRILGREVPFLTPWNGQIMEGVIDLIYEKNGLLYLADYKTDRLGRRDRAQAAARYRQQAEIYCEAARRSLGREVAGFKLFFLRQGATVDIKLASRTQPLLF